MTSSTPTEKPRGPGCKRTRLVARIALSVLASVIVLIGAVIAFTLTFDWNRAKPWINDTVSQSIGRPFAIAGDLKVEWRWRRFHPSFSATHIEVANPDWARAPHFATLDRLDFDVLLLPLLVRRIEIPTIGFANPSVDIERLADGRNNWTFQLPASSRPSAWELNLHDIAFTTGNISVNDLQTKTDLTIAINLLGERLSISDVMARQESDARSGSAQVIGTTGAKRLEKQAQAQQSANAADSTKRAEPLYAMGWTLKGSYNKAPVSGTGRLGGMLALQDPQRPFPVQADVRVGDMHVALVGTLSDPAHLAAIDLRLWLQGTSMAHLYKLTGVPLPDTPPYATEGRLVGEFRRKASRFRYENFTGRVGGSDLNGTLSYVQRPSRPLLRGALVSNLLQFSDLAPIIGADSNASKAKRGDAIKQPADRVIPVEPFRTDRWTSIDADVTFTGKRIIRQGSLPITDLDTHIVMTDGMLSLDPLRFGVADGTLAAHLALDGNGTPLKLRGTFKARHLKLKQLFPDVQSMQSALGEINGDASLSATGNSPAALAATANGELKAVVTQGAISRLLMEAAGLNVANVAYEKMFGNRDVQINCAAADFIATNGVLEPRVFALDTDAATIDIDGPIDLRNESLDLKIHPHTKAVRVLSLRSPLYARGTFKHPRVGVDAGALALRGGAIVGLSLVNPFAALLPLIAPNSTEPLPCDSLLAELRKRAPKGSGK